MSDKYYRSNTAQIEQEEITEPTTKTITIKTTTWKRLQRYGFYRSTFDSIINDLLSRVEGNRLEHEGF